MSFTRLQRAQWMADKGIVAFIIDANSKRPLGGNSWYIRNTIDPQQLAEWFDMTPNCNYGLHLGERHVVVDLDIKPGIDGIKEFDKICQENGIENWLFEFETFMTRTPRGGYHLYFKTPHPCANKNNFPDGIDVRGAVGYVVGPGSENTDGVWEVIDESAPIMDIPEFLLHYLLAPGIKDPNHDIPLIELDQSENIEQAIEWLRTVLPATEGENGDDHTYEVCCMLRDFGISETEALHLLNTSGWNERCEPPWDDAELEVKIKNSYSFGQNRPGIKAVTYERIKLMAGRPAGGYGITNEQIAELFNPSSPLSLVVDNTVEEDPDIPTDVLDNESPMDEFKSDEQLWYGIEDFAAIDQVREYIVKGWLIAHGITALLAARGTGKSTIALDLACHLTTDQDWWGTPTMKDWCVIYICGEDDEGMILNVRAWAQYHGVMPSNDRFLVAKGVIKMTEGTKLKLRLNEMREWARGRRCITILDTWARATSGYSSNTQEEMDMAYENAEAVARALNGPMIACFHPPKDGRMTIRGSAVQEDASSGIWNLEKVTDGIQLTVQRAKGRGEGSYRKFRIEQVTLPGTDFYKDSLEGVVPIKISGTEDENTQNHVERVARERKAWATAIIGAIDIFPSQNPDIERPEPNSTAIGMFLTNMWLKRGTDETAKRFVEDHMIGLIEYRQMDNVTIDKNWQGVRYQIDTRFISAFKNGDGKPVIVDRLSLSVRLKANTKKSFIFEVGLAEEELEDELDDTGI